MMVVRSSFALLLSIALSSLAFAGVFVDNFDDNQLSTDWVVMNTRTTPETEKVEETDGVLMWSGFQGGWEGAGVRLDHSIDFTQGPVVIEFDIHQRAQDFHPYFTNAKVQVGDGGLWNKGIFAFNIDFGEGENNLGFERDKPTIDGVKIPTAEADNPALKVTNERSVHIKQEFIPTNDPFVYTVNLDVDNGAQTATVTLNISPQVLDVTQLYLYLEAEHDDHPVKEWIKLDNFSISSPSIAGDVITAVEPTDKLPITWGQIKRAESTTPG